MAFVYIERKGHDTYGLKYCRSAEDYAESTQRGEQQGWKVVKSFPVTQETRQPVLEACSEFTKNPKKDRKSLDALEGKVNDILGKDKAAPQPQK